MKHRIRVAGILYHENRLLLVEQYSPRLAATRWSPPGGGLEPGDKDIFQGVEREVLEETGLAVRAGSLRFVSEFVHHHTGTLMLELWIDCLPLNGHGFGDPHLCNVRPDDGISDVRWWTRSELAGVAVNRPIVHPDFWNMLQQQGGEVRHLGRWEE